VLWFGTALLVAFELIVHLHDLVAAYSKTAWLATAASGVVSTTLATVFWNIGLNRIPASDAGVFINLEPLVGSLCGVALFGDRLGWPLAVGATLIIAAAAFVTRPPAEPAHPPKVRQVRVDGEKRRMAAEAR
jgi:drug/metabolite transporter (DMT)-like permease